MKTAYRTALICWAAPLVNGLIIFGGWLYFEWRGIYAPLWGLAGIINILFGVGCVLVGLFALLRFVELGYRDQYRPRLRLWGRAMLAALLLFSNFGVAYGMVASARYLDRTQFSVYIGNNTSQTLPQVHLSGAGCDVDYGSIAPGANAAHFFWIKSPGSLQVQTGNPNVGSALISSLSPDHPASMQINFNPNGPEEVYELGRNIPEPSTYALAAGITALGFALLRRRQKP